MPKPAQKQIFTPSATSITKIAELLLAQESKHQKQKSYAAVKNVLALLGTGVAISALILAPGAGRVINPLIVKHPDWEKWKHYNPGYLRRTLKRLRAQKHVEIVRGGDHEFVQITERGRRKILGYSIDMLTVEKPKRWDGKWRLVLYDIPTDEQKLGDIIRTTLKTLGFYAIQKSVYLCPYPCFNQIEFIREYYNVGDNIQYMLVAHIEHDEAYKTFFCLS